ncbi:unnamed protein product [Schistocephalus solidus]|uniref:Secreted protein n=1 Tax=Schistocephalus solidus TaxID=70667 RepID=A0A183T144_SCHSO|nr:unnamed protein product [Schistocephalus solidus]
MRRGVIFVAVAFGLVASATKEKGVLFLESCTSISEVVLKLIRAFLKYMLQLPLSLFSITQTPHWNPREALCSHLHLAQAWFMGFAMTSA